MSTGIHVPVARAVDSLTALVRSCAPLSTIDTVVRAAPPIERRHVTQEPDARLRAALVGAYHRLAGRPGARLCLLWLRTDAGAPVKIAVSGYGADPAHSRQPLLFPPAAWGQSLDPDRVAGAIASIGHWSALAAQWQPEAGPAREPTTAEVLGVLEDGLPGAWPGPFALLLIAEPIPVEQTAGQAAVLAAAERDARTRGNSPEYQMRADLLARAHRQARTGCASGLWRVHLLAGGPDPDAAATVAGIAASSLPTASSGHVLIPQPQRESLTDLLAHTAPAPDTPTHSPSFPFTAGADLLERLLAVPRTEIPGVRVQEPAAFDLTPETPVEGGASIELGHVLDRQHQPAGPWRLPYAAINRHVLVAGATGAGKSQSVRTILEELTRAPEPVPWLVIEPAKAEYARMAGRVPGGEVLVIRPGDLQAPPGCLNPLEPEPGFPLQTHLDLVRALFLAAFDAEEPFPQVLAHALTRCYRQAGWDPVLGTARPGLAQARYPSLGMLRQAALEVVGQIGYGPEVTDNVRGFIDVRISSLRLGTPGRFFEGGHRLEIAALLERNVVLELEDVGTDADKAFVIGAVLIRLTEHLRLTGAARHGALRHVTVIEEAHRLLKHAEPGTATAHAVELFTAMLAEIRAYGEGIVIAEQIPAKISADVVKNTDVKIMHRLPAEDDRRTVGAAMNLDTAQSRQVVSLPAGRAAVFTTGMDRPILVEMPLREQAEDAAGALRTAPTSPRSPACAAACTAAPCTLHRIASAAQLAEDPHLTLWLELLTVAHLVGEPAPRPDPVWIKTLTVRYEPRLLRCAITELIHSAVADRFEDLAGWYRPRDLAQHLAASAESTVAEPDAPPACDGTETAWQAGRFRWIDVYRALETADPARPHPDAETWVARGLDLPGARAGEQLAAFFTHPDNHRPARSTITGTLIPPRYEQATARLSEQADPAARLRTCLDFLNLPSNWPVTRLYPDAPEPEAINGG